MTFLNVQRFGFLENFSKTTYHIERMSHKIISYRLIQAFSYVSVGTVTAVDWMAKAGLCVVVEATFLHHHIQMLSNVP
jgi:hypothetical protein